MDSLKFLKRIFLRIFNLFDFSQCVYVSAMSRLSVSERVEIVELYFENGRSATEVQRKWSSKYGRHCRIPHREKSMKLSIASVNLAVSMTDRDLGGRRVKRLHKLSEA